MNVRKALLVLMLSIAMCSSLMATGVGDVEILLYDNDGNISSCGPWPVRIWFKNDAPLYSFSIGLELRAIEHTLRIIQPHGTLPASNPTVRVGYNPTNAFDLGIISVDVSQLPDFIFISGAALNNPLPPSGEYPSFVLEFVIVVGRPEEASSQFCVDNIVHQLTGKWVFSDVAEYAPTFNGIANNGTSDPSAPAICVNPIVLPCGYPVFTAQPPTTVSVPKCETYSFDFDGVHPFLCGYVYFGAAKGTIDTLTGYYELAPDGGAGPIVDTIFLYADFTCGAVPFVFTINRTNAPPEVNNCRPILFVQEGTAKAIDYDVSDADNCDTHEWSLTLLSGTPPTFPVSIDPASGVLIVDATGVTAEEIFDYQVVSTDAHSGEGTETFQLRVTDGAPGDADGSGSVSVSDAVFLIAYIFSGGPQPISEYGADPDCSGGTSVSDAVYLINYIFSGGLAPCGVEP